MVFNVRFVYGEQIQFEMVLAGGLWTTLCDPNQLENSLLNLVINGTDTGLFSYKPEGRKKIREELGVGDDIILIGMAAECRAHKRHSHFLIAAKLLTLSVPNVRFLFCGIDTTRDNRELMQRVDFLELGQHMHLLGIRNDMVDIYSALDIHTLNPRYEPFGLALTEAMSCETPCVASDVGIMGKLLDDVGFVYPMEDDPSSLVNAWKKIIALPDDEKRRRVQKGRQRISEEYSIGSTAKAYDAIYERVAKA